MMEIRHDPLRERRILVAEERAGRPNEYRIRDGDSVAPVACPFCPGNERETPPELAADRPADSTRDDSRWTLRVVPNRYPALCEEPSGSSGSPSPPFVVEPARGAHEVLIECRDHAARIETMPLTQVVRYLIHLRERARCHRDRGGVAQVLVFRNSGACSGASLSHPHTQLAAMTSFVSDFRVERDRATEHFARTSRCLVCDLVAAESTSGARVVAQSGGLVAVVPFAARYGAEVWILPVRHPGEFTEAGDDVIESTAALLQRVVGGIAREFEDPSFNVILNAWSTPIQGLGAGHWRIEIVPRLANVGGFELASGDFIVSRTPEESARRLRAFVAGAPGD